MAERHQIVSQTTLQVDGEHLDEAVNGQIIEITVDQHAHLPAMFTIRLHDPGLKLLDGGPFNLASKIEITSKTAGNQSIKLITGEVTALEPAFGEGMIAELTIRGYDQSHRLYRERKSKTYLNVKDSDLAAQIAKAVDLTAEVDATKTVYAHLYQHNQSDLEFLRYRAQRIGYECFVQDGKLFFRKPVTKQATVTIAWGNELIIFRPRLTLSEQVEEVWVKGWDVQKKTAIIGRADHGNRYARTKEKKMAKHGRKHWGN